jgi:DNA replication protein DnaC
MNTQHTIEKLIQLRLHGMAKRYKTILDMPLHQLPDLHTLMAMLVECEEQHRCDHKSSRMLKKSKLRYHAVPEDIHCGADRGLSKDQLIKLLEGSYIRKGETILISGPTGTGKSFLACALGRQACLLGHLSRFIPLTRLFDDLSAARLDGSYRKYVTQLERTPLLILDDFGLKMLDAESSITLKEILDDRYRKSATIITSQLPVNKWYDLFKEATHADAIMDRLTAKAHQIALTGKSKRQE